MRFHLLGFILLSGTAVAATAQSGPYVQPEITTRTQIDPVGGIPAGSALANLTARIDALEAQLASVTGQYEEASYRVRQLERELETQKKDFDLRLRDLERAAAPPQPTEKAPAEQADMPIDERPTGAVEAPNTGDAAEDAYLLGYRQWEAGQFAAAAKSLEAMAKKYPKHRRASYARNLAGRAYIDDGKPATAAKILLANYQTDPKGERAADSLYFLGQSLVNLKRLSEACKVYDELADQYPEMRDWVKQRLPKARSEAKCS